MEIIKLISLLFLLVFVLVSCSSKDVSLLSYQEKPFRAHVILHVDSLEVGARITSFKEKEHLSIEFTSPKALEGIVVTKSGNEISAELDGTKISSPELFRLADISRFFTIDGVLTESSVLTLDGRKLNLLKMADADGTSYSLYLYSKSGLPRHITSQRDGKEITLDVISFEFIPE